ncbi:MAG: RNA-binding protein, partial [Verrucomicrobiota bacterium]
MEKILTFLTFGLYEPDLIVRKGDDQKREGERRTSSGKKRQDSAPQNREEREEREQRREPRNRRDRDSESSSKPKPDRPARQKRPPEPTEVTTERLYVGNLDYETTEADLYDLFNGVGKVRDAEVVCHKYTQRSKGYAFVVMNSVEEAKRAVDV